MPETMVQKSRDIRKLPVGMGFKAIFVVASIFQKTDKNGKIFHEIRVADEFGTLEAKVWSDALWIDRSVNMSPTSAAPNLTGDGIRDLVGKTVGVDGRTAEFRGQTQFNFNKVTLLNQEAYPAARYLPRSPIPADNLAGRCEALIEGCRPKIRDFLKFVYNGNLWRSLRDYPAAVGHHHAYASGLLEHTVSVTAAAKALAEAMRESDYDIDIDVTVAGALLHDIGKIASYKMGAVPEMTLEGAVLDHVALGYAKFTELAAKAGLDDDIKLQLAHIILSHHGQKEFGSPVVPATPEALCVAAADDLDFKMFCWKAATEDLPDSQPISQWHAPTARRYWKR